MDSVLAATPLQILSNIIVFFILYRLSRRNTEYNKRRINKLVICGILLFSVFAYWGTDYFHYLDFYIRYRKYDSNTNIEDLYLYIVDFASSYSIFRLIVWGAALCCFVHTAKRLELNLAVVLYLFTIFFLLKFSYARVSLGMAVLFLGFSYWVKPGKFRSISIVIGALLIVLSGFCHKSMILAIVLAPIALVRLKKWHIYVLLALFPVFVFLVNNYLFDYIIHSGMISDDSVQFYALQSYSSQDAVVEERGLGGIISYLLLSISVYMAIFFLIRNVIFRGAKIGRSYSCFMNYAILILYASSTFAFMPFGSDVFYYRFMYMMYIPLICAIGAYVGRYGLGQGFKITFSVATLNQVYALLYSFYIAVVS